MLTNGEDQLVKDAIVLLKQDVAGGAAHGIDSDFFLWLCEKAIEMHNKLYIIDSHRGVFATVEDRILFNKAKHALVETYNWDEKKAYKYLQKQAMDTRSDKAEVAKRILAEIEKGWLVHDAKSR